jgi:hypothetical protein
MTPTKTAITGRIKACICWIHKLNSCFVTLCKYLTDIADKDKEALIFITDRVFRSIQKRLNGFLTLVTGNGTDSFNSR